MITEIPEELRNRFEALSKMGKKTILENLPYPTLGALDLALNNEERLDQEEKASQSNDGYRCQCGCGCTNKHFNPTGSYCSSCASGCCGE